MFFQKPIPSIAAFILLSLTLIFSGACANSSIAKSDRSVTLPEPGEHLIIEVTSENIKPDEKTLALIAPYKKEVDKLREPIIQSAIFMPQRQADGPLGHWMADSLRNKATELFGQEVHASYVNNGGIRTSLPQGGVSEMNVFQVMPFENRIVVFEANGDQMLHFCQFLASNNGNFPHSGVIVDADEEGNLISAQLYDGTPITSDGNYFLATSDFLASMRVMEAMGERHDLDYLIRDAMLDDLRMRADRGEILDHPEPKVRIRVDGNPIGELRRRR